MSGCLNIFFLEMDAWIKSVQPGKTLKTHSLLLLLSDCLKPKLGQKLVAEATYDMYLLNRCSFTCKINWEGMKVLAEGRCLLNAGLAYDRLDCSCVVAFL